MFKQKRLTVLSMAVVLALLGAAVMPFTALADDVAPPPTEVPVVDAAPTEEPVVEVAPTEDPVVDVPPTESVSDVVAALADANAVLLDADGNPIPLASQEAADILTSDSFDPFFYDGTIWIGFTTTGSGCPAGVTCLSSPTPLQAAISNVPDGATVYVAAQNYGEAVTIDKNLGLIGYQGGTGSVSGTSFSGYTLANASTASFTLGSGANISNAASVNVFAPVVNVNAGASIQDGITLIDNGGTVNVAAGTYTEQIVIDKSLTLVGVGAGTTVIQAPSVLADDPDGAKTIVLFTGAITAEISGFTIQGPVNGLNFGIYVRNGATANIHDNTVKDIRDEPLSGNQYGYGIEIGKYKNTFPFVNQVGHATITNNIVYGYQKNGIEVEGAGSTGTITGNTVTGGGPMTTTAQNGIQIRRGATGSITNNTVTGNAYILPSSCEPSVSYANCYTAAGIIVTYPGNDVVIQGNTVNNNTANIYTYEANGVQILNNQVSDSAVGLTSAGITADSDNVASGSAGITGVTISGNTIRNNLSGGSHQGDGIFLWGVKNSTVSNNTIEGGGYDGILIGASGNITITNNLFSENGLLVSDPNASAIDFGGVYHTFPYFGPQPNLLGGFSVHDNSFEGNQNGVWNYDTAAVNASGNWWGTTDPAAVAAATSGSVDYTPWLNSGTNASTGPGFQGDFSVLNVGPGGEQTGTEGRIQEAVDLVTGSTVNMMAGDYTEDVNINDKDGFTLQGAGSGTGGTLINGSGGLHADNNTGTLTLQDFAVTGSKFDGIWVEDHDGAIVLSGINSSGNGLPGTTNGWWIGGAWLEATGTVTVSNSVFSNNLDADQATGLYINSLAGPVTLNNVTSTGNDWAGLALDVGGQITLTDITASDNGDSGAWLNNCLQDGTGACTNTDDVSVTNSVFDGNDHHGLDIATGGTLLLTSVTADSNGQAGDYGSGLSICNYFDPDGAGPEDGYCQNTAASVTINGTTNVFNNNEYNGFEIYAAGPIALTNITANDNDGGAWLDAGGAVTVSDSQFSGNITVGLGATSPTGPVTLNNVVAEGNIYDGIDIFTDGNVTLTSATITGNGTDGVYVDGYDYSWAGTVTVNGGTFTNNGLDTTYPNTYGLNIDACQLSTDGAQTFGGNQNGNIFFEQDPACVPAPPAGGGGDGGGGGGDGGGGGTTTGGGTTLSPLLIPVTGGEQVTLNTTTPTMLQLPSGNQVSIDSGAGTTASVSAESETSLPATVPSGNTFVGAMTVNVMNGGTTVSTLPAGTTMEVSFVIPSSFAAGQTFSILYWNPALNGGLGDWETVPATVTSDGHVVATVNFTGTFVLVTP